MVPEDSDCVPALGSLVGRLQRVRVPGDPGQRVVPARTADPEAVQMETGEQRPSEECAPALEGLRGLFRVRE